MLSRCATSLAFTPCRAGLARLLKGAETHSSPPVSLDAPAHGVLCSVGGYTHPLYFWK